MTLDAATRQRIGRRLARLYGDRSAHWLDRLVECVRRHGVIPPRRRGWDQRDLVLITYGDQVRADGAAPLATLREWLAETGLEPLFSAVHVLPFFPYSSDDGFSVIDYRRVDPALGDWNDIAALAARYELMVDLVINHCSSQSRWFQGYLAGEPPYVDYFIEVDPALDLSRVVRPRSLPLLTPFDTSRGRRHVWTTFSADQIDLNFANGAVLVEMVDVLLHYLRRGARIIRLDAIAYLWKRLGTPCIHLPETHEVVKLLRDLVDAVAPGTILLTETNVPHEENVSYFGRGDEAHMVYQFSLAPLLVEALLSGDAGVLAGWLARQRPFPEGCTALSFTASHDGIGVRPLEGILPPERFERFLAAMRARGARIAMRRAADGTDAPYEINATYFSALGPPTPTGESAGTGESVATPGSAGAAEAGAGAESGMPAGSPSAAARSETSECPPSRTSDDPLHVPRFLASQAVMLALRGIPAVYFHSLVATPNDIDGARRSGQARSVNRRKFTRDELDARLADPRGVPARVLDAMRRLLAVRIAQSAFHPDAPQAPLDLGAPAVLGFLREAIDGSQRVVVLANCSGRPVEVDWRVAMTRTASHARPLDFGAVRDLLAPREALAGSSVELGPYQVRWIEVR